MGFAVGSIGAGVARVQGGRRLLQTDNAGFGGKQLCLRSRTGG
jgi:hypothetical protein